MRTPCAVVGAGAAGLAVSRCLVDAGVDHVVLERRDPGDTWKSQRWDSFRLNTPGWMNATLGPVAPDSFSYRDEVVRLLGERAASLPVRTGTPVLALSHDGVGFVLRTPDEEIRAATVVLAHGLQNVPRLPPASDLVPTRVLQLHTGDYRSADELPDGAVLVVGGAQSGCQIAEDLALAGRRVHLATSRVGRMPWTYRGRELIGWLVDCGFWDQRPQDLPDPADVRLPTPVVASGGRSLSLQILAGLGVRLLGRLRSVEGETLGFDGSPKDHARYGDEVAARLTGLADAYIAREQLDVPDPQDGEAGVPVGPAASELDLAAHGVGTVVWATGFTGDLSWVRLPVLDGAGRPRNDRCGTPVPGLWLAGFPWLTRRRSGILFGMPEDAREVTASVVGHLARTSAQTPGTA